MKTEDGTNLHASSGSLALGEAITTCSIPWGSRQEALVGLTYPLTDVVRASNHVLLPSSASSNPSVAFRTPVSKTNIRTTGGRKLSTCANGRDDSTCRIFANRLMRLLSRWTVSPLRRLCAYGGDAATAGPFACFGVAVLRSSSSRANCMRLTLHPIQGRQATVGWCWPGCRAASYLLSNACD